MTRSTIYPEDRRDIAYSPHDEPLRADVRELGALVGDMLAEQDGDAFFERVEQVRTAAIQRRVSGAGVAALASLLDGAEPGPAGMLARAFATWFGVVNTAERVHRIRRHRDYQCAGATAQPESLGDVLETLKSRGVGADELLDWIARLDIEPVFTAHPTEAVRRSMLEKEQDIVRALADQFDTARTPRERLIDRERLRMALTSGWQTAEASNVRPSVQDEFDHIGFYLSDPLYRVVPVFYETFRHELQRVYGVEAELPRLLRFGSWVGGDMDGNPNVGADTIDATLRAQRALVLERYRADCASLARELSQTDDRVQVSSGVRERLALYRERLPEAAAQIRPRHANMPYRCVLTLMHARLQATEDDAPVGYAGADEFEADVALIGESLKTNKGANAGLFAVRRLLWRVRTFGFHLARLDVRQDARVHDDVLAILLGDTDWVGRDSTARAERLRPFAAGAAQFGASDDEAVARIRDVFATLADARTRYGNDATGPYIISMARSAADVLAVLALARNGGLVEAAGARQSFLPPLAGEGARRADGGDVAGAREEAAESRIRSASPHANPPPPAGEGERVAVADAPAPGSAGQEIAVPLDIAPLFETIDDLRHAADSLRALLADPVYRAHLAQRGDRQMIMVGYSDSAKDGGILAARWALQRAQSELLDVAREAGIKLTFFHGRGGSACRGGSKVTPALMASPRGAVAGRLRVTEQGEVIHRKYGIRALALRNLEQTVGATLRASLRPREPDAREVLWIPRMDTLAAASRAVYRDFVGDPDFVAYFRTATPVDVIERMTMSSRPASRRSMRGVEDLRAIPWVFAWTQMRSILPGWYGLGSALARGIDEIGEDALKEMARDWPFLHTLLDDVEMMLAKADLDIAESFSRLSGELHEKFFPRIADEFQRTRDAILRLKGSDHLLAGDRRLAQSIQLRNPYIDPMSVLQVDLLRRWRAAGSADDALLRSLVACVNGVARGLQNTG
ncbi:MAG TPA: phosphoenolpyruvate carboxylase [Rhodanobacteraceae bacterium]|nr:phosphoenolpyruvate carboxylase [Rhodanobacteraceae bacterium]